jgi:hypothetical protein
MALPSAGAITVTAGSPTPVGLSPLAMTSGTHDFRALQSRRYRRRSTKRQAQETSFRVFRGSAGDSFGPADFTK